MTRGSWKKVAIVLVAAVAVLAIAVWGIYFHDWSSGASSPLAESTHPGSASTTGNGEKGAPAGSNPVKTLPTPEKADPPVVRKALEATLTAVDSNVYWDKNFAPISTYQLRQDKGDLYLKWLYLEEIRNLHTSTPEIPNRDILLSQISDQIAAVRQLIRKEKPESQSYFHAYTQWYELVCYCHAADDNIWIDGGEGSKLLEDVLLNTRVSGSGRARMDGSVCSAMMYGTLTLYYYSDRPNGAHLVGKRLGIFPPDKKPALSDRSLVQFLTRSTTFVESCYPGGVSTDKLGLRYSVGHEETLNLVGGKILYFCSKAVIAREEGNLNKEKEYLDEAASLVAGLSVGGLPKTPYGYAYVLRATALLIRLYVVRQDWDRVRQLTTYAQQFLKAGMPPKTAGDSSEFYLPLIYLQFRNEVREVMDDPVLKGNSP